MTSVSGLPVIPALPPTSVTGLPAISAPPNPFSFAPAPSPAFTPAPSMVLPIQEDESKKLRSWQIVLIILAALLVLGVGGYILYLKFSPPQKISPFK